MPRSSPRAFLFPECRSKIFSSDVQVAYANLNSRLRKRFV